jgi:glycogen debranching enzyme
MGYSEIHVNQEHDYVSVHRMHPLTHDGYLLIARTAFKGQKSEITHSPIRLRNQHIKLIQCASLTTEDIEVDTYDYRHRPGEESSAEDLLPQPRSPALYHPPSLEDLIPKIAYEFDQYCDANGGCINGMPSKLKSSTSESFLTNVCVEECIESDFETVINIIGHAFEPGSIVMYRTWMAGSSSGDEGNQNLQTDSTTIPSTGPLDQLWKQLGLADKNLGIEIMTQMGAGIQDSGLPWGLNRKAKLLPGLQDATRRLQPSEINVLLFRTASEERDTIGQANYDIPGFGSLAYCGLQGFVSVLLPVARSNDLGHPVCSNMRQGPWIYDYVTSRLQKYLTYYPGIKDILDWLSVRLCLIKKLPPAFAPKYFAITILSAYEAIKYQALFSSHNSKIPHSPLTSHPSSLDIFAYACALTSFQMNGSVKSTGLIPGPYPLPLKSSEQMTPVLPVRGLPIPSLAAGLPHFSTEYCRCWGRDIFIAIRGLFLIPGNFEAARSHILAFGSTLKHGLIPNLLDQGIRPRYNARDAVWFWMEAVFDFCRESPEGFDFLEAPVARRFIPLRKYTSPQFGVEKPGEEVADTDDYIPPNDPRVFVHTSTVAQLCHEILERHVGGIEFREWNAGAGIDHAMRSDGFNVSVTVDRSTGFVKGGSRWNCGTWMDKMGDSVAAGINGVPATPRDGSAVELVGLQKSVLRYINKYLIPSKSQSWPWEGVSYRNKSKF